MTLSVIAYVRKIVDSWHVSGRVLEVGSLNVNGTVRDVFYDPIRFPLYSGIDFRKGLDVDIVMRANYLGFRDETFDCLVCCEMLEHDNRMWESIKEFYRVLRKEGYVLVTVPGIGFQRHGFPSDYWRFTVEGVRELLEFGGFVIQDMVEAKVDRNIYCAGKKL